MFEAKHPLPAFEAKHPLPAFEAKHPLPAFEAKHPLPAFEAKHPLLTEMDPQKPDFQSSRGLLTAQSRRVMEAAKLLSPTGRRKAGEFLAEGPNSAWAALRSGSAVEFFATAAAAAEHHRLVALADEAGVPVRLVDERAARKLTDAVTPVTVVARCPLLDRPLSALLMAARLVVVLVEPSDPGNLGTVLRAAHAFGADAFVVLGDGVDPHNPKAVRSSAGSLFAVPVARERDVSAGLRALVGAGLTVLATTADGELPLDGAQDILAQPTAWLFGNEAHGLPADLIRAADHRIAVPMRPAPGLAPPESLNLAVTAGVCLYESSRARVR